MLSKSVAFEVPIPGVGILNLHEPRSEHWMEKFKLLHAKIVEDFVYFRRHDMAQAEKSGIIRDAMKAKYEYELFTLGYPLTHPFPFVLHKFNHDWADLLYRTVDGPTWERMKRPMVASWAQPTENIPESFNEQIRRYDKMKYPVRRAHQVADGVNPQLGTTSFLFPNDENRDKTSIVRAFGCNGFDVVDIQYELTFLTSVVDHIGNIWVHDTSHGGGGFFAIEHKAK